ncbi:dolichyl-phosphate-mannose--protein mannosyltransferase [Propionibacteriaceae bacterium Y1700]|uniref:dolichyl-phosphate-mannose--protein mannosyltransferase n=1 Tax=Microlunatus sp. Y1700 TaxID=3418487 RepID=UPI003DA72DA3
MPTDRLFSWLVTTAIAVLAFCMRIPGLGNPNKLVFDETYYPKDAWTLSKFGYEKAWDDGKVVNPQIVAGNPDVFSPDAAFIVHPQLGKWLIAAGEHLFGMNSFGWRFPSLIFGVLLIIVTIRLVRRVSRSTVIGGLAGLLLTLDGLHFVMSRIGLLDIFLAFFVLAAVACLAVDRDWFRERLARHLDAKGLSDLGGTFGPVMLWRPWRMAAGVMFGLACGVKWNGLYALAAFAVLSLAWDIGARRLAGAGIQAWRGLLVDGVPAFVQTVVIAVPVYVATWASWLATTGGWARDWGDNNPAALSTRILGKPLASLLHYHSEILNFHAGDYINGVEHTYDARPIGWLVMARPIGIDAVNDIQPGTQGCPATADKCLQVISGAGTPVLWWGAAVALVVAAFWWIGNRDWRFGIPVVGVLSSWLPWFGSGDRPMFFFYAIVIIPFSVMALSMALGRLLGPAGAGERRMLGAILVGSFTALVAANFAFLHPILTDKVIPYQSWLARMWFKSWI